MADVIWVCTLREYPKIEETKNDMTSEHFDCRNYRFAAGVGFNGSKQRERKLT